MPAKENFDIDTTSKQLFPMNPKRVLLGIINTGATVIYVAFDRDATTNSWPIPTPNGSLILSPDDFRALNLTSVFRGQVNVISSAANGTVTTWEE